jgi:hypothetical protein
MKGSAWGLGEGLLFVEIRRVGDACRRLIGRCARLLNTLGRGSGPVRRWCRCGLGVLLAIVPDLNRRQGLGDRLGG